MVRVSEWRDVMTTSQGQGPMEGNADAADAQALWRSVLDRNLDGGEK